MWEPGERRVNSNQYDRCRLYGIAGGLNLIQQLCDIHYDCLWLRAMEARSGNRVLGYRRVEGLTWGRKGPSPWNLSHGCDHLCVPSSSNADLVNFFFSLGRAAWCLVCVKEKDRLAVPGGVPMLEFPDRLEG